MRVTSSLRSPRASNSWLSALILGLCLARVECVRAEDLMAIVTEAVDHDAGLAGSRADYETAQQAVPKARAALLPHLDGGWGRTYNRIATDGYAPVKYWQNGWTVTLSQPVFDWGRWMAYKQASVVQAHSEIQFAQAQQDLLLRAARAYFDELAAEDEFRRGADYTAAVAGQLDLVRHKRSGGEATVIDLREAQVSLEAAQVQQMEADENMQAKRRALEQLTGRPFSDLSRLSNDIVLPHLEPDDADSWAAQAESGSYPVQLAQTDVQSAQLEIKKVRAEQYPVVSLTGSYSPAGAASGYSRPTTTATAMLTISIPIYEGGELQSHLKESYAGADKADSALESAQRQAEGDARDSYARFHSGLERIDALQRMTRTATDSVVANQLGYKVGSRSNTDVLRAFDTLYTGKRDLMRASYDALVAFLALKASTATLDLNDIAQVSRQLSQPSVETNSPIR
jgi:outer membrane protein